MLYALLAISCYAFVVIPCIEVEQGNASLKAAVQELQQKVNNLGKSQTGNYVELVPSSDKSISTFTCNQVTVN